MINKYFKIAGDLNEEQKNITQHFKPSGDLNFTNSENEIRNYLLTIVSGEQKGYNCELGSLCGGGSMIVTFDTLKEMVEQDCYNFIKAEYLNPEMIVIEYQKYNCTNDMNLKSI